MAIDLSKMIMAKKKKIHSLSSLIEIAVIVGAVVVATVDLTEVIIAKVDCVDYLKY